MSGQSGLLIFAWLETMLEKKNLYYCIFNLNFSLDIRVYLYLFQYEWYLYYILLHKHIVYNICYILDNGRNFNIFLTNVLLLLFKHAYIFMISYRVNISKYIIQLEFLWITHLLYIYMIINNRKIVLSLPMNLSYPLDLI